MQMRPRSSQRCRTYRRLGLAAARHLRGDIDQVRAEGDRQIFRVLFATEGQRAQILLSLEAFSEEDAKDAAGEDLPRGAKARRLAPASSPSLMNYLIKEISTLVYCDPWPRTKTS